MSYPIRIEEYDTGLFELTDLTVEHLQELESHLTMSAVELSPDFKDLHKGLRRFISSLDTPCAG